jgi:hypothetical protein
VLRLDPGRTALLVVDMPQGATLDIIARAYARVAPVATVVGELDAGDGRVERPLARRKAPGVERSNAAETL